MSEFYKAYTFTPPEGEPFSASMPSMEAFRDFLAEHNLAIGKFSYDLLDKHGSFVPPKGKRHAGTMVIHLHCQVLEDEPLAHEWVFRNSYPETEYYYTKAECKNCGVVVVKKFGKDEYGLPAAPIDITYFMSTGLGVMETPILPSCGKPE